MNKLDIINGLFEAFGAWFSWQNFFRLRAEREIKGVVWQIWLFYAAWGLWNIVFYPAVGAYFSAFMGVVLVGGNIAWCALAVKLSRKKPEGRTYLQQLDFDNADTARFERAKLFPGLDHPELYGSTENNK